MLNAIFLLLLTGLIWSAVGVLIGAAPSDRDRLYSFYSLNGILFTAFVWITQPPSAASPDEVLRLAALMMPSALMEVFAFLLLKRAMDRGSQGIAWSIAQSAMVIPFLGAVFFLHNQSTAAQWTGLACSLLSLVLFGRDKPSNGTAGNDATYFRLVFGSFALIGLGSFLRLIPGYAGFSAETLTWRLPLQSPVGMVFWTTICLAKRIWEPNRVWRISLPYAIVVALGQISFYAATDAADALRITSVVMPVTTGTCILGFALWCQFIRREHLSRGGWLAVALAIVGIALLSSEPPPPSTEHSSQTKRPVPTEETRPSIDAPRIENAIAPKSP